MYKMTLVPDLFLALLLIISGAIYYGLATYSTFQDAENLPSPPRQTEERIQQILQQFVYTTYELNKISNVIEGDSLIVNPRRVGFFNVKNINEITVSHARHDVYLRSDESMELNPFLTIRGTLSFQENDSKSDAINLPEQFGIITRQVINNLEQNIYHDESLDMVISSRKVYIDNKDKRTVYLNTSFTDRHTGSRLLCRKAIWEKKEERFRIPGAYILIREDGQERGHGISLDLDFVVKPL